MSAEPDGRTQIGIWSELAPGDRWSHEGVSRVIGFLIEGAAKRQNHCFHVVVRRGLASDVRDDLRTLSATENVDWQVHEPTLQQEQDALDQAANLEGDTDILDSDALALFANRFVPVDGWVITFPFFTGSLHLKASKAVLFPDGIPFDFPLGWITLWEEDAYWPVWLAKSKKVCAAADAVINFSEHVAARYSIGLLGVAPDKIHIVPLAPPDLAPELPFVINRTQTGASRAEAAAILRDHAALTGLNYLRNFPFEECDFVVGATQDRPTKNLAITAEAVERIVRDERQSLKLFLTAPLHFDADWTRLPGFVERQQFHRDFNSLYHLPRQVHAALFHAASVTVHASFYEGIIGCLPLFESVSVGTPCVFARGPHVAELLAAEPEFAPFTFDPYDLQGLVRLIRHTVANREAAVQVQQVLCERLRANSWSDVADGYVNAALARHAPLAA